MCPPNWKLVNREIFQIDEKVLRGFHHHFEEFTSMVSFHFSIADFIFVYAVDERVNAES